MHTLSSSRLQVHSILFDDSKLKAVAVIDQVGRSADKRHEAVWLGTLSACIMHEHLCTSVLKNRAPKNFRAPHIVQYFKPRVPLRDWLLPELAVPTVVEMSFVQEPDQGVMIKVKGRGTLVATWEACATFTSHQCLHPQQGVDSLETLGSELLILTSTDALASLPALRWAHNNLLKPLGVHASNEHGPTGTRGHLRIKGATMIRCSAQYLMVSSLEWLHAYLQLNSSTFDYMEESALVYSSSYLFPFVSEVLET
eukprot:1143875-Pelagomonas_calceolata.AAC.2